ncbi:MAG: BMP family ABC transporter substrate-binding protein [Actinomycetota bacterium]|nr:BMP family ABC transporter substrate-binding protein [Actinomycetota bacterium]
MSAAAAVATAGFAVGTSSASPGAKRSTAHAKITKIAIALPAKPTDYGWNQQGLAAAQAAASSVGAKLQTISNIGYNNTQAILSQLAQSGAQFIIAHASGFDTAAKQVALRYKVPVMTYDVPGEDVPGLVSSITTSAEQGGYLAGILAAKETKTGTVGIVISASDSNWFEMSGGFAAGVASVNKKIKVLFEEIGPASYDDSAGGKRVASTLISANADVIFGMGDDASFGYLQAISTAKAGHKVWYIGDIGNMGPIDKQHVLLSSEIWSFTKVFKQAVADIQNGTYGKHAYNLTLANGGISMLKTSYISSAIWAQMQAARAKIVSGSIKVPVALTIGAVRKLVASA